ncbi:Crp/Fnr family transcriptional regulator [Chitinimonas viridis]|uniref:Crp/Fnr family transcriptional regulator n=1 Tax=Chitinimonas viridis TaxID=664880 RepID=A0ABT8B8J0_9NEIS|nr:Crp/Fnr family transcriptional regulator [Chitinimonas viridis]MDN3578359.1 Crp/Fnr family transcriptional regulator [Chitinimonas viridis]
MLYEPGTEIAQVYFPYGSVVSLLGTLGPLRTVEVAAVGREGVIGGAAALGDAVSQFHAVVQVAGMAARIPAARMRKEFKSHGSWNPELLQFNDALMGQMAQAVICNRFHTVEARLARWLLTTRDRAETERFYMTQAFLARILGVRRVGVSAAAAKLQDAGLIGYSRGHVALLDTEGLEAYACECYGLLQARCPTGHSRRPDKLPGAQAIVGRPES